MPEAAVEERGCSSSGLNLILNSVGPMLKTKIADTL